MSDVQRTRLPDGRWRVRWRQGKRRPQRTFDRKGDADTFATSIRRKQQLGEVVDLDRGRETLGEWMETWWASYAVPNLAPRTRETYKTVWGKHILPRLGGYELRELTPAVVEDFRAQLHAAKVGDPTILKALTLLQGMLKRAVVRDRIDSNPVLAVDKPRQRPTVAAEPLPPATVERIRALVSQRDAAIVSLMAYAGLRPEEVMALRWSAISKTSITVHPTPHWPKRRVVRLLAPVAGDLNELRLALARPARTELVFPRPDGEKWRSTDWRNWRRRVYQGTDDEPGAARQAGVTGDLRPYRLRGSFVSLLLWEGRSVPYVAEQAGHTVAVLSEHYAGVMEELEHRERMPAEQANRDARARRPAGGYDLELDANG